MEKQNILEKFSSKKNSEGLVFQDFLDLAFFLLVDRLDSREKGGKLRKYISTRLAQEKTHESIGPISIFARQLEISYSWDGLVPHKNKLLTFEDNYFSKAFKEEIAAAWCDILSIDLDTGQISFLESFLPSYPKFSTWASIVCCFSGCKDIRVGEQRRLSIGKDQPTILFDLVSCERCHRFELIGGDLIF